MKAAGDESAEEIGGQKKRWHELSDECRNAADVARRPDISAETGSSDGWSAVVG